MVTRRRVEARSSAPRWACGAYYCLADGAIMVTNQIGHGNMDCRNGSNMLGPGRICGFI